VEQRPEIQVVLTTHAGDILAACKPEHLVILRAGTGSSRRSLCVAELPITPESKRHRVMRMTRLHLDSNRSVALFGDRVLLVEGVTEVVLVRQLGRVWAGTDQHKLAFVDALTVAAIGLMPLTESPQRCSSKFPTSGGAEVSRSGPVLVGRIAR